MILRAQGCRMKKDRLRINRMLFKFNLLNIIPVDSPILRRKLHKKRHKLKSKLKVLSQLKPLCHTDRVRLGPPRIDPPG